MPKKKKKKSKAAKGKRQAAKKKPSRRKRARKQQDELPPLPDARVFEAMLSQFGSGDPDWDEDSPAAQAQELVYQAFEAESPRRQQLAGEALSVCPDCADAYVLLAEDCSDLQEAIELYGQGIAAAERTLGEETFRRCEGNFWGVVETRPYMRARLGLAQCLHYAGRTEEAVEHFQELLRLNPMDNQGVRWTLAGCLLELGRDDDLAGLLAEFSEDGSTFWAYSKALLAFRQDGDSAKARQLLSKAIRCNRHVVGYLLGNAALPQQAPEYFTPGEEDEAVIYVVDFLPGWRNTPGAISWLRQAAKGESKGPQKKQRRKSSPAEEGLADVQQIEDEVWQADVLRAPEWIEIGGDPIRPWVILVTDSTNDLVMTHDLLEHQPPADALGEKLCEAIRSPMMGSAHRPGVVQVRSEDHRRVAGELLESIGVRCVVSDHLDQLDHVFDSLCQAMFSGESIPALVEVDGMELKHVGGYFEAAASFFQRAPWRLVPGDTPIKVECDKFKGGPWYAVVMGQSGMTLGLALYEDYQALQRLVSGQCSHQEAHDHGSALSVTFDEEFTMASADVEAAEQFGWPVATPEAYPGAMRLDPGHGIRPPNTWELELLEGSMRAIPEFLANDQGQPQRITVPVVSGQLEMVVSWPLAASGEERNTG